MIFKLQFSFPMQPDIQASSDFGLSFLTEAFPPTYGSPTHTPLRSFFLLLTPAVTPTGIGAVGWGLMILSPSAGYSRYIRSAANTCTCFSWKATREARRGGRITELRPVVSFRPVQLSQPFSILHPLQKFVSVSLWRCILRYDPSPIVHIQPSSWLPSSPQSKKAKTAARKLKPQGYCPVVCSFWARGGKQPKRPCIRASRRFGETNATPIWPAA